MSGHSFGAVTTQAVSGQRSAWGKETGFTDKRIIAAGMLSPSAPQKGNENARIWLKEKGASSILEKNDTWRLK